MKTTIVTSAFVARVIKFMIVKMKKFDKYNMPLKVITLIVVIFMIAVIPKDNTTDINYNLFLQ